MALLKKAEITQIFECLQQTNPNPEGELNHRSNFELLVAVVLSAQATDISVNKATGPLFERANTPEQILAMGEATLRTYIQSIGLYRSKAKHIIGLCQQLLDQHHGHVPDNLTELMRLPGVGRKTANVVLNMAFGLPTIAVDTHVYRVSRRLGLTKSETELGVEKDLLKRIPKTFLMYAHHWLILHGRYVCQARKPRCSDCQLQHWCQYSHS